MNEITDIMPQIKDKTRCNIYVDGRFYCGLTLEATIKNRLKVGQIITPEKLSQIQLESERNTAFDKALTHISATQKTEKQVRDFLSKKGYLPAVVEYVLEKLRSYDFLNDGAYAENYVGFAAKKKGGRLIRMELRGKGIDENAIENALETIDEEQELQTASAILEKYMRNKTCDKQTLQKAYRYLLGKGFEYETIRTALGNYGETDDEYETDNE